MNCKNASLFSLLMITLGLITNAQNVEEICWQEGRKLCWEDFRRSAPSDQSSIYALSTRDFRVSARQKGNAPPSYQIVAIFRCNESWTRGSSEKYLEHEQLHFDLTELLARKMRKAVDSLREIGETEIEVYKERIQSIVLLHKEVNLQYDKFTGFGNNEENQKIWNQNVTRDLVVFDKYKFDCDEE